MSEAKNENTNGGAAQAGDAQPQQQQTPPAQPDAAAELAAMRDRLLRLQADFDNFRRRAQREKAEWSVSANENIVKALLPVLDHYELGLKTAAAHKTEKAVQDGFQMIYDQLLHALKNFGLAPLDVHESGFDPVHHEAVAHIPSDEYPADAVIQQTRRGWKLGDKLLRPVQVVISSGPGAPRDDEEHGGQSNGDTKAGA